ncbi:MAG TPA: hypothetical protein VKB49_14105 [Candidatus Sulfotelmatobacter sp.]|nr:hypothetical protein [Candidatus Sulfotelmatobacter sp.]
MNTLFGKVTRIVLILGVLVGTASLLIATGNSNELSTSGSDARSLSPTKVGPVTTTNVLMVYDSDNNGLGGSTDMIGPEIGTVKYKQGAAGSLTLTLHTDFGQPNTTYNISLTCGPSHALACGFLTQGTLTTNATGVGNATDVFPVATLQAAPFGCGFRTDHVDLIGGAVNSVLTAGAINYFVPCAAGSAPTMPTEHGDPTGK